MENKPKRDKTREKASIVAARNRRELIAAGLNRRDMLKMGLLTSAGMLIPKIGLSARPLTSAGFLDDTPQSRPTRAFIEEMPRLVIKQPTQTLTGPPPQAAPNTAGGESRTVAHQAYTQFPPQKTEFFLGHSSSRVTASRSSCGNLTTCPRRTTASE